jgi:hypothetical protein
MKKNWLSHLIIPTLTLFLFTGCQPKEDPELRKKADSLAQATIIVDTHIDLPYRHEMEPYDVTQDSKGEFDYVKAKEGGFNSYHTPRQVCSG